MSQTHSTSIEASPVFVPKVSRVKRKPPPALHLLERYPPPDPQDPFAPLSVLRHRTSTALALKQNQNNISGKVSGTYFELYPHSSDGKQLPDIPSRPPGQEQRDVLYRTFSQPVDESPLPLPPTRRLCPSSDSTVVGSNPSSILSRGRSSSTTDAGSDNTLSDAPTSFRSPGRSSRALVLKKFSLISLKSTASSKSSFDRKRRASASSTPGGIYPANQGKQYPPRSPSAFQITQADAEVSPRPSHDTSYYTRDSVDIVEGYQSQPEYPAIQSPTRKRLMSRHESMVTPVAISTPTSSSQSNLSSSYVDVPAPLAISLADDGLALGQDVIIPTLHLPAPSPSPHRFHFMRSGTPKLPSTHSRTHSAPVAVDRKVWHTSSTQGEWTIPTMSQLSSVYTLPVISESGVRIPFGSLFAERKAIIIFIRHFWCPLCQDYMAALTGLVRPEMLTTSEGGRVDLVVIGNGAHPLIQKYRKIFGMPFRMFTDPSLKVYETLGMRTTHDCDTKVKVEEASYARKGALGGLARVVMRAVKVRMPVWEKGGDIMQLGGEFVFGPGLSCSYAHRMQSTQGHAPIRDVLAHGGVPLLSDVIQMRHISEPFADVLDEDAVDALVEPSQQAKTGHRREGTPGSLGYPPVGQAKRRSVSAKTADEERRSFILLNEQERGLGEGYMDIRRAKMLANARGSDQDGDHVVLFEETRSRC